MHKRMRGEHARNRFPRILWAGHSSEGVLEKGIFAAVCGLDCDGTGTAPTVHMLERLEEGLPVLVLVRAEMRNESWVVDRKE